MIVMEDVIEWIFCGSVAGEELVEEARGGILELRDSSFFAFSFL